jgi:carbon storage regulator
MLVLTRKPHQVICIGSNIRLVVLETHGNRVRLGIDAPADVYITRQELNDRRVGLLLRETPQPADLSTAAGPGSVG